MPHPKYFERINGTLSDVRIVITEPTAEQKIMSAIPVFGDLDPPKSKLLADVPPFTKPMQIVNVPLGSPAELRELLAKQVLTITFVTAEGEIRTMDVTQDNSKIPVNMQPKVNALRTAVLSALHPVEDARLFKVWSVDRAGWRSIRHDRIQHIRYVK